MTIAIPTKLLEQHNVIVGKTGAGKTNTARGFAEYLLSRAMPICIVDPTGVWWGLRSSADGKSDGFPIAILGGRHGDVPLTVNAGPEIAEFVAGTGTPVILDLSEFSGRQATAFMEGFAERLYQAQRDRPLHLFLDEADSMAPQRPMPEGLRLLGAIDKIARRGRVRGFRLTLITQRPAVLAKDVMTQANALIAMRVTAPQDRKAIDDWVRGHADGDAAKRVMESLAKLPVGSGWVWAPELDYLELTKFPQVTTFDSGKAPDFKKGSQRAEKLAPLDLNRLTSAFDNIRADIEANDPKKLRARIAELEKAKPTTTPIIDQAAIDRARGEGYGEGHADGWRELENRIRAVIGAPQMVKPVPLKPAPTPTPKPAAPVTKAKPQPIPSAPTSDVKLSKAERLLLSAIAETGTTGCSRSRAGIVAGYSSSSGHFDNVLGALRTKGFIEGGRGENLRASPEGVAVLGDFEPMPSGDDLRSMWLGRLGKAERAMLQALIEAYPDGMPRTELGEKAGYSSDSGHFDNCLGRLRTLELVTGGRGEPLRASDNLF